MLLKYILKTKSNKIDFESLLGYFYISFSLQFDVKLFSSALNMLYYYVIFSINTFS